jgi:hypothetical protein
MKDPVGRQEQEKLEITNFSPNVHYRAKLSPDIFLAH